MPVKRREGTLRGEARGLPSGWTANFQLDKKGER